MDNNRTVDVSSLLKSIAGMVSQDQKHLDKISGGQGNGTHGQRVAQAFQTAARAAQESGSQDAGAQLAAAAQAMREQGQGRSIGYYANGLEQAAAQFSGRNGISTNDLGSLLDAFAGGVQQGNPAQPGQGTMLDALLPAAQAFMGAQQGGMDTGQAAMQALSSAANGAYGTMQADGGSGYGSGQGFVDPGAASATSVLGGIVKALLPSIAGMAMQHISGSQSQQSGYAQPPGGSASGLGGLGGLVGGLLSGSAQPNQQGQAQGDPFGGLGGLLGGLMGGASDQPSAYQGNQPQTSTQPGDTVA
jgi:hypothetical protein